jgi:hypothetical protein
MQQLVAEQQRLVQQHGPEISWEVLEGMEYARRANQLDLASWLPACARLVLPNVIGAQQAALAAVAALGSSRGRRPTARPPRAACRACAKEALRVMPPVAAVFRRAACDFQVRAAGCVGTVQPTPSPSSSKARALATDSVLLPAAGRAGGEVHGAARLDGDGVPARHHLWRRQVAVQPGGAAAGGAAGAERGRCWQHWEPGPGGVQPRPVACARH